MNQDTLESRYNPGLPEQLIDAVRISQNSSDIMDEAYADFMGINRTDGRCLDIVQRLGRITAGDLARESGLTTGSVTVVVDRLEAKGFLRRTRDKGDRRKVFIEVTPLTENLANSIYSQAGTLGQEVMGQLKPNELDLIIRFLRASSAISCELSQALQRHNEHRQKDDSLEGIATRFATEIASESTAMRARILQSWKD